MYGVFGRVLANSSVYNIFVGKNRKYAEKNIMQIFNCITKIDIRLKRQKWNPCS